MQLPWFARAALAVLVSTPALAEEFHPLTPATCHTNVAPLFTTGGQYLDPNNGVRQDAWSMLMRWQGINASDPVSYDVGAFTGLNVPAPYSSWQRGQQPESSLGTAAAQVSCHDAGMVLNTWTSPRTFVEGGGFNDMYGYAWSPPNRPRAFNRLKWVGELPVRVPTELVLQGTMAVPVVTGWNQAHASAPWNAISNPSGPTDVFNSGAAQLSMFAYLRDTSHPTLRPIGVLGGVYANNAVPPCPSSWGNIGYDYPAGAWFTGNGLCNTDLSTVRYTGALTTNSLFSDLRFFRMHVTRQNLVNLINRINGQACRIGGKGPIPDTCICHGPEDCPPTGYSTNPDDYVVEYTGVLGEIVQCHQTPTVTCNTTLTDRQISMAARIQGFGAFAYTP
ncbi:hypothetical protein [Myxococcus eversor]|uniref:hypothetical protein n=1 Tax=Myxococcus eversor TaxID=2709661 RepID=UPI0013D46F0E|nr:hypothetical protein [Myxococcus eversor]